MSTKSDEKSATLQWPDGALKIGTYLWRIEPKKVHCQVAACALSPLLERGVLRWRSRRRDEKANLFTPVRKLTPNRFAQKLSNDARIEASALILATSNFIPIHDWTH
jgi:hypothetical protein